MLKEQLVISKLRVKGYGVSCSFKNYYAPIMFVSLFGIILDGETYIFSRSTKEIEGCQISVSSKAVKLSLTAT